MLSFAYDPNGWLRTVTDNTTSGRSVKLEYAYGRLETVKNPDYTDTKPNENKLTYYYDNNGFLTSIFDFTNILYLTNQYDQDGYGRVVKQILGGNPSTSANISDVVYDIQAMMNTFYASGGREREYTYNSEPWTSE